MKIIITILSTAMTLLVLGCGQEKFSGSTNSKSNASNSTESQTSQNGGSSSYFPTINGNNSGAMTASSQTSSNSFSLIVNANSTAQSDCSQDGASFTAKMINAEFNTLGCMEFMLTVPSSSPDYGKSYACDANSKFKPMNTLTDWTYNEITGQWTFKESSTLSFIRNYVKPGFYRMVAKNSLGDITYSEYISFGRSGKDNCQPTSNSTSTTNTKTYQWTGVVFGPVAPPTSPACGPFNVGRTTVYNNVTWTCVYQ